jgi:hypothetical protein
MLINAESSPAPFFATIATSQSPDSYVHTSNPEIYIYI